jgi:CHASE2 domain-containing sensor protein
MSDEAIIRKPRHMGHRIALACAALCAGLMVPAFAAFVWFWATRGTADTWTPSLAAVVAFLGCCAGVLYATSVPQPVLPQQDTGAVDPEKR